MRYQNPDIESSYRENNLGKTLYNLVLQHRPKKIVEFGSLNGYSAICMAMALDEIGEGKIESYDLFEDYEFKHGKVTECNHNAQKYGVDKYITFLHGDIWKYKGSADMFHVDISNDGDIIKEVRKKLFKKFVVFEGGSQERDEVEWMQKYRKSPISGSVPYILLNEKFPSISKLL
jgi:hypothetical protein